LAFIEKALGENDENEKKYPTTTAGSMRTPSPRREGAGGRVKKSGISNDES